MEFPESHRPFWLNLRHQYVFRKTMIKTILKISPLHYLRHFVVAVLFPCCTPFLYPSLSSFSDSLNSGCKLKVPKTFRRCPERFNSCAQGVAVVLYVYFWYLILNQIEMSNFYKQFFKSKILQFWISLFLWTQGVNWTYIRRSEDVQDIFWTSYERSI